MPGLKRPSLDRARAGLKRPPLDRARAGAKRRPIDRAWPALPLLALVVAVIVAVIGIVAAPRATDAGRIADAVKEFARAAQERRGPDACARLTPTAQQAVAARTGTLDCAATVRSFGVGFDAGQLRVARIVEVEVAGDRATIARDQVLVPDGKPFGRALALERIDGEWRVAAVG